MLRHLVGFLTVALLVSGCGGAEVQKVAAERDQSQAEVAQLKEKVLALEAEVIALKEAPQELLKKAVEAREKGDFDQASKLLDDLQQKYPASPEAEQVSSAREQLTKAIAAKKDADRKAFEEAIAKAQGEATPEKARAVLQVYLTQNPASAFKVDVEKKMGGYDEQIRVAAEEAKKPPMEIVAIEMGENSIGTPTIDLTLVNRSKKEIDGFEFSVDLYDNYDRPVSRYRIASDGNTFSGIAQEQLNIGRTAYWGWTMYGFDLATKYKNFRIRSVHFTDGSAWRP